MKYIISFVLYLIFTSCSDDELNISPSDLQGEWIEVESLTDTLLFESRNNSNIFHLKRAQSVKFRTGPYEYRLTEDKISLYWMLSSNYKFDDYHFKVIGNRLEIGNFYDSNVDEILIFEKVE